MIKLYFKQAFHLLGENKLLSSISIIGTALAIAMIMVIVITLRATIAPFAPETHRDRMLIFRFAGLQLAKQWPYRIQYGKGLFQSNDNSRSCFYYQYLEGNNAGC